ncbi:hypothetical protein P9222_14705 [Paenibacillus amylolyticus]|nr:hypothetical protein [Paenibacillus amylolyticus]WFR65140.1 hypothetical protein P9222_14705 [Paenibacillus amylolyticus]
MSFNLERQYNSTSAQFYDMDVGYNTYEYPIYQYFVAYNAVKKKKIPIYHVKYTENMWIQWDNNGDGNVDSETAIIETNTIKKGTYTTESEAKEVASHRIVYFTEPEPLYVQKTQYNNQDSFPASLAYNEGGFIGTLSKSGSAKVVSANIHRPKQLQHRNRHVSIQLWGNMILKVIGYKLERKVHVHKPRLPRCRVKRSH